MVSYWLYLGQLGQDLPHRTKDTMPRNITLTDKNGVPYTITREELSILSSYIMRSDVTVDRWTRYREGGTDRTIQVSFFIDTDLCSKVQQNLLFELLQHWNHAVSLLCYTCNPILQTWVEQDNFSYHICYVECSKDDKEPSTWCTD